MRNFLYRTFNWLERRNLLNWISDKLYLKILYYLKFGRRLNLKNPQTLIEKLQWLKLYNRRPEYTMMVDKLLVKDYVASIIGDEYIIPTLHTYDNADDIDFSVLPDKFVLKCNHTSSHGVYICDDKKLIDENAVRQTLKKGMKCNYYKKGREWPYKNVKRKIICEKFICNNDNSPIADYKFYCYGGKPRYFMYSVGEASHDVKNHKFNMQLESIDSLFKKSCSISADEIQLPDNIDEMINIVKKLCVGFPHIRIDLYNVNGKIYFGEMTFFSNSGFINILSDEYSQKMADYIELPDKK